MANKFILIILSLSVLLIGALGVTCYKYPAYIHLTIGHAFYGSGKHELAINQFNKSITIFEEQQDPIPEILGFAYSSLGKVYQITKEYDKSIECYNKALPLLSSNPANHTYCLLDLGLSYYYEDRIEEAEETFNKSIIHLKNQTDINESSALFLAKMYYQFYLYNSSIHNYDQKFKSLENAIHFFDLLDGPDEWDISLQTQVYRLYAIELEERDRYQDSEIYYHKALALTEPDSPSYFQLLEDLGINCSQQDKYEEASGYYEKAKK